MEEVGFEQFLINENRVYLGKRINDILNALQDLVDNAKGMGTRHLVRNSEGIVNQIRRVVHTNWPKTEERALKVLQKVGVAISKAIEEKDDLEVTLQSSAEEIEKLISGMDVPVNKLATPPGESEQQPIDKPEAPQET